MSTNLQISTVNIELSQHETESEEKIGQLIKNLLPFDSYEKIKKLIKVHNLTGFHKNQIKLYKIQSIEKKLNKIIFLYIMEKIKPEIDFNSLWERFSVEDHSLYLRINKQDLSKSKLFILDDGSDIIKIVFKFSLLSNMKSNIEELKKFLNNQIYG
ncbi:MAG: RNA-binding domain-containing protein [Candidatus Hodarchaeales archaeon]|jgi:RNA binding exosome subunit